MENCFNEMLEYGEAIKSSFVKDYVSDWPEESEEEIVTPASIDVEDEIERVAEPEETHEEMPETEE